MRSSLQHAVDGVNSNTNIYYNYPLNMLLNFKEWNSVLHLVLNNGSHSVKSNSMTCFSVAENVLQNLKVIESAIGAFMAATSP
jgi:hypothetical protein